MSEVETVKMQSSCGIFIEVCHILQSFLRGQKLNIYVIPIFLKYFQLLEILLKYHTGQTQQAFNLAVKMSVCPIEVLGINSQLWLLSQADPGRQQVETQVVKYLPLSSWLLASVQPSSTHCVYLGSEPIDEEAFLSVSFSLSTPFQKINIF